jgi:hypothetical protein
VPFPVIEIMAKLTAVDFELRLAKTQKLIIFASLMISSIHAIK